MEGQRHTASEISFQVPENSVTWSVKHLLLSSSALVYQGAENIYGSVFLNLLASCNKCPDGDVEIGAQYLVYSCLYFNS